LKKRLLEWVGFWLYNLS